MSNARSVVCARRRILSLEGIRRTPLPKLERLIRSAGYFRQKASRLKTFVRFLDERYAGSLARMFAQPTAKLREELLALNGVGPETADSILLYAGNHPVFVVDAYTRRILERHELVEARASYEEIRALFESALAPLAERWFEADGLVGSRVETAQIGQLLRRAAWTGPAVLLTGPHA